MDSVGAEYLLGVLNLLWLILKVAIGIGFVIFVHELGHFLVAKACGVKCEKFLIGFDVPIKIGPWNLPRTLWKKQWGETLYAIGIIPLGGYVKMLGQDDNPSNYEQEAARTRVQVGDETAANKAHHHEDVVDAGMVAVGLHGDSHGDHVEPLETVGNHAGEPPTTIDPRSYTAKSVPQRMAIISAGVIMNVIFAVLMGAVAYGLGVSEMPAIVAGTAPGSPAWTGSDAWDGEIKHLQAGDKIVQIGRNGEPYEHLRFDKDLMLQIFLAGSEEDLELLIERGDQRQWVAVRPRVADKTARKPRATIGVELPRSLTLSQWPALEHLSAGKAEPAFEPQDKIVAVNGQAVEDYPVFQQLLAQQLAEPLTITVERQPAKEDAKTDAAPRRVDIRVAPNPQRTLGIHMQAGPLVAVQANSPADAAGLQAGDAIESIDGQPLGDPLTLGQRLQARIGQEIPLVVLRDENQVELTITPRPTRQIAGPYDVNHPVGVEELGIAFHVLNRLTGFESQGPAAASGLQVGDRIVKVEFVPPSEEQKKKEQSLLGEDYTEPIVLDDDHLSWPHVHSRMQKMLPETQIKLTYERGGKVDSVTLTPAASTEYFNAERGFILTFKTDTHYASSFGEAMWLGYRESKERFMEVLTVLWRLVSGQLSVTNLAGPARIAYAAGAEASQGVGNLLIFLTFLSVNLAVINALPIPVLDGGHFFFLLLEGIRGKPVSEKWVIRLTFGGLIFLLTLMAFVFTLDIGWFAGFVQ